ncbi:MAG: isochorismatase family protein [Phycisphaerales bacterium]|nr:isochorismatase family protein [Phycisphaerales bacterium]
MNAQQLVSRERAMLLLIDMQTRLLPHIDGHEVVVGSAAALIEASAVFELPVVATVQYVRGLGETDDRLGGLLASRAVEPIEKAAFSVCRDAACRARCADAKRPQVIVTGIEAHICVMQTVLDLLGMGLQPIVCADAVSSRRALDREVALRRMAAAGAIVTTTESVLFELAEVSGTAEFKHMLDIVKRLDAVRAPVGSVAGVV